MKQRKGISYQIKVTVYLEGKPIGEIREEIFVTGAVGYRYYPRGQGLAGAGEWFPSLAMCQRSLVTE